VSLVTKTPYQIPDKATTAGLIFIFLEPYCFYVPKKKKLKFFCVFRFNIKNNFF